MPARQKPVKNLDNNTDVKLVASNIPRLAAAPATADKKNIRDGEKRSAIFREAKLKVPVIKPSCTAETKCPKLWGAKPKLCIIPARAALPANQSEVQANCDSTIINKTGLELSELDKFSCQCNYRN